MSRPAIQTLSLRLALGLLAGHAALGSTLAQTQPAVPERPLLEADLDLYRD